MHMVGYYTGDMSDKYYGMPVQPLSSVPPPMGHMPVPGQNWRLPSTQPPPPATADGYRAAPGGFAVVVHGNEQYALPAEMPRTTSQYDVYGMPTHYDAQSTSPLSPTSGAAARTEQYRRRRYSSAPQHVYDHRNAGVLPLYMPPPPPPPPHS